MKTNKDNIVVIVEVNSILFYNVININSLFLK